VSSRLTRRPRFGIRRKPLTGRSRVRTMERLPEIGATCNYRSQLNLLPIPSALNPRRSHIGLVTASVDHRLLHPTPCGTSRRHHGLVVGAGLDEVRRLLGQDGLGTRLRWSSPVGAALRRGLDRRAARPRLKCAPSRRLWGKRAALPFPIPGGQSPTLGRSQPAFCLGGRDSTPGSTSALASVLVARGSP
jgi:hypothetical protein